MRKILLWTFMLVLLLLLVGCRDKAVRKKNNEAKAAGTNEISSSTGKTKGDKFSLPDSYPKEILPLAADAVILDVRENPANKGLEVVYVSDVDIDTLCEFHERALKGAKDLSKQETSDGYIISAKLDGVGYTIMLSKSAMNPNPKYARKKSVYIILNGLKGISEVSQKPQGKGKVWPSAELPGVPQLKGHISQILREAGIIRLEITVENAEKVKGYIRELTAAGFSFDTQPNLESDHMEFLAFKDSSMMSFAYKGAENLVTIEYQR